MLPEPGAPDSLSDSKQISIYGTDPREHFVTTWEVPSANNSITLPAAQASGTYTVYWGDGHAKYDISGDATHVYEEAGNYTVSTQGLDRIRLGADAAGAAMLRSIDSWGTVRWTSMSEAFRGASSMMHAAGDVPDPVRCPQHGTHVPGLLYHAMVCPDGTSPQLRICPLCSTELQYSMATYQAGMSHLQ